MVARNEVTTLEWYEITTRRQEAGGVKKDPLMVPDSEGVLRLFTDHSSDARAKTVGDTVLLELLLNRPLHLLHQVPTPRRSDRAGVRIRHRARRATGG